ncbi:hypothetical protein CFOL_v3_19375, partial [Cephalotus follicularis]
ISSPFLKNSLSSPSLKNSANASLSLSQSKQTHLPLSPSLIPELQLRRRRHKFDIRHTVSDCLNLSSAEIARKSLAMSHAPMLIGSSIKRFLGEIRSRPVVAERDPATIVSVSHCRNFKWCQHCKRTQC